jgi:hypothetical protein
MKALRASQRTAHTQTGDWPKPEMVSIGLTLTSLFISGEKELQPMDIRDEEETWLPLRSELLRLRNDTSRSDVSCKTDHGEYADYIPVLLL